MSNVVRDMEGVGVIFPTLISSLYFKQIISFLGHGGHGGGHGSHGSGGRGGSHGRRNGYRGHIGGGGGSFRQLMKNGATPTNEPLLRLSVLLPITMLVFGNVII